MLAGKLDSDIKHMAGQKIAQNTAKASSMTEEAVAYAAQSSEKVNQLGNAAKEISKVTEVITEISDRPICWLLMQLLRLQERGKRVKDLQW